MKQALLSSCRSPCCFASLDQVTSERRGEMLWQAKLSCQRCGHSYTIQDGVAYLTTLDTTWSGILKELVNRRSIVQQELEGLNRDKEKAELKRSQDAAAENVMEALFQEALKELRFEQQISILDVGAGLCQTSAVLAERGAEVVATETEIANLQYVSFEETDPEEPESININGKVYYRKNPVRAKRYFSRVLCNAERLPFASGAFDVVFCRSVIHHVQNMGRSLREMVRVLRNGGRLILCSEPIRSFLDREEAHICEQIDKIEGMNERRPTLASYLLPLIGRTRGITIQYWQAPFLDGSRKLFSFFGYDYNKHLRQGEKIKGLKIVKLLPVNASINLFAVNNQHRAASPEWLRRSAETIDIDRLLKLYTYKDLEEEKREFKKKTGFLVKLRRDLMALRNDIGTEFRPAKCRYHALEKGWLGRAEIAGRWGRHTDRIAVAVLKRRQNENNLELIVAAPENRINGEAKIRVNGIEIGKLLSTSCEPQKFDLRLDNIPENVLVIDIENDFSWQDNTTTEKESLQGLWVYSIKIF